MRAQEGPLAAALADKKRALEENVERANEVQKEIHEYIQLHGDRMPSKLGPQLLVQLWEYHLVKVLLTFYWVLVAFF